LSAPCLSGLTEQLGGQDRDAAAVPFGTVQTTGAGGRERVGPGGAGESSDESAPELRRPTFGGEADASRVGKRPLSQIVHLVHGVPIGSEGCAVEGLAGKKPGMRTRAASDQWWKNAVIEIRDAAIQLTLERRRARGLSRPHVEIEDIPTQIGRTTCSAATRSRFATRRSS